MLRLPGFAFLLFGISLRAAPIQPLVCPAGGPIGSIDLRVASPRGGSHALPLRTINRLEEGDILMYRPLLHSGEERKGEVTLVLAPANAAAVGEKLRILDAKPAGKPQKWQVPFRVSVVAFVYGPSGLSERKVRNFLSRDETLIAQLADYAEKTAQTEALIEALSSPSSSTARVQSALQGFASQYDLNVQIDKNAPANQQALALFRTLNPAIAAYDPISQQSGRQFSQTASLAASVATLFFGSPVGLAAGGTAMLMELRSLAFPRSDFRSSFSQSLPQEGLGLCGSRDPAPRHTKVAYVWASRVPNVAPPQLAVEGANSLPAGLKSAVQIAASDADWKVAERARSWALEPRSGKPIPVEVQKLGVTRMLEIDANARVQPGTYTLVANWDWDRFRVTGNLEVRRSSEFAAAHLAPSSQDLLVEKTGKLPVTLEGDNFEFVTKVAIQKAKDKFASPSAVPFVLPRGLRQGPQDRMDLQINTIDLEAGNYELLLAQLDGQTRAVKMKILPAPPAIENLPLVLHQGATKGEYPLKGRRLELLERLEVPGGTARLAQASPNQAERKVFLELAGNIEAGTALTVKAFIRDRTEPMTFSDAVRIIAPRPSITAISISQPADPKVQLWDGELPGGAYLSAMLRVAGVQANSTVRLSCAQGAGAVITLRPGERSGDLSLQHLAPDQLFLSFDTSAWFSGCMLRATVVNGREGESDAYAMGRIVRAPEIGRLEVMAQDPAGGQPQAQLTGRSLETIARLGWTPEDSAEVTDLPLPSEDDRRMQTLQVRIPAPPEGATRIYVWLRGEAKPRLCAIGELILPVKPVEPVE